MSRQRKRRQCRGCQAKPTRSTTGLCERCRTGRTPAVTRHTDGVHIENLGVLDHQSALALAHAIADLLNP